MKARPVVGIICCTRTVGTEPAQAVINRYVTSALRYADAAGLLVPALPDLMSAREVAPRLDGLLLTGSPSNVAPDRYGPAIDDAPGPFDPGRDDMVLALTEAMTELGRPVFGICRGFQELNVAFGGTLRRDLGDDSWGEPHHAPDGVPFDAMFEHGHRVNLVPDGLLAQAFGRTEATVNSVHYQGIERLAPDLTVEATAPDGVVEAFSAQVNGAPVVAVQWHPEWRPETNADSRSFFALMGRALRGDPLAAPAAGEPLLRTERSRV